MSESPEPQPTAEFYEFGPFRVDPAKETLLRAGENVPITPKTFQLLLVLVRNHREVVTKDDLMKSVWPDTFVEEANLSRNIFMLRKALGETAQQHRYIVTVPGQGYRLTERVRVVRDQDLTLIAASHSTVQVEVRETRPWGWIAAAALIALAAGIGGWRALSSRPPLLTEEDTVVLADFRNSTGDPLFDETLRQGLMVQLRQSSFLSLISDQRIAHTLKLMGQRADARLTPEVARVVCERTGSTAVVEGSITSMGSQYVLGLQARSCRSGEVLAQQQQQVARKEDLLSALGLMANRFRQRVGESLTSIKEHDRPLAEATTPSLEALEAYSTGWKLHTASGAMSGLPFLKRATEIDPAFALAQATLGREYASLEEADLAAAAATRAMQLSDRTSDAEKFFITATYEGLATGNLEKARQNDEAWSHAYPREAVPHALLSGYPNKAAGRYEQAIGEAQKAIVLDPDFSIAYYNLAANYLYLGQLGEAENVLRRAAGRGLQIDEFIMLAYDLAFLQGDHAGMERAVAQSGQRAGGETWIANKQAFAAAYDGHLQQARNLSQRAVDEARENGQPERAGLWQAGQGLREAFFQNPNDARKAATAALALSRNCEVEFGAALALAVAGESSRALLLSDDLQRRFAADTVVQFSYLPVLRASMALNRGNPLQAIEALRPASPYELGASRLLFGALYPAYVRGEAYLANHQGAEAVKEFQKILDHRGVVGSDPIAVLAYLQKARAFAVAGDAVKAGYAYEEFFAHWQGADVDIPILERARAEYRALPAIRRSR